MADEESSQMLSKLLFDEKRCEVLQCLFGDLSREFSIVELAEETDLSRQFVSGFVQNLSEVGLVEREKRGNMYLISVNEDSAFYDPLKEILKIDSKPLKDAAESFAKEIYGSYNDIESVVLYGSVARGIPNLESDIDLLVIHSAEGTEDLRENINAEAEGFNKDLNINISPSYYEKKAFLTDLKAKRAYAENIVEEGEVLAGEKFWQNE